MKAKTYLKRILLVDADIVVYRASVVVQHDFSWDEDSDEKDFSCADFEEAKGVAEVMVKNIQRRLGGKVIMCLSSPTNFRYDVLPTYKHNRKDKSDPILRQQLKQWVKEEYETLTLPNCEADDVLGIEQNENTIICSIDKDLDQIPGRHYDWDKELEYEVSEEEGEFFFYMQALKGDPVDGYSGCPRIGQKRAFKLLRPIFKDDTIKDKDKAYWDVILKQYDKKGLDKEFALQQARVARILTPELYNKEKGEVVLWEPTYHTEKTTRKS